MSVTVYIWDHDKASKWGHCSLEVTGGPYISWWPAPTDEEDRVYSVGRDDWSGHLASIFIGTTNVYKVRHRNHTDFQMDLDAEGRSPLYTAEFRDNVLDEDAIRLWWTGYGVADASCHSIKKNCSTTVVRALEAGGSDQLMKLQEVSVGQKVLGKYYGWEPTDVHSYLVRLQRSIGEDQLDIKVNKLGLLGANKIEVIEEEVDAPTRGRGAADAEAPEVPDSPALVRAWAQINQWRQDGMSDENIEAYGMWPDALIPLPSRLRRR